MVRNNSATYFWDYYLFRVCLLDFAKGFATEQSAIKIVYLLQVIVSRQQRHLLFRLLFVQSFSFRFRKGICRRAIRDRENAFIFVYFEFFNCDDGATYSQKYYLFKVPLMLYRNRFITKQPEVWRLMYFKSVIITPSTSYHCTLRGSPTRFIYYCTNNLQIVKI